MRIPNCNDTNDSADTPCGCGGNIINCGGVSTPCPGPRGPQGIPGPQGPQGPAGAAGTPATVTVGTVTTGAPGTAAAVTNSGTASNAVLNFVIPQGATGATGPQGPAGPTGATGPAGAVGPIGPQGPQGPQGETGPQGPAGPAGAVGATGATGATGAAGPQGPAGPAGATGATGPAGPAGAAATIEIGTVTTGAPGTAASVTNTGTDTDAILNFVIPQGATGATGPQGPAGEQAVASYGDFYALMPGDNADTVAPGTAVDFPQSGPADGITPATASTFTVTNAGTYLVVFQVSVTGPGQLALAVNGTQADSTVAGRATGTDQVVGMSIQTLAAGDTLSVINPTDNNGALTITPSAGGATPVSAHLVIVQLA